MGGFWLFTSQSHAAVILQDDFNYVVDRDINNAEVYFQAHGWTGAKAMNSRDNRGLGYLYTITPPSWPSRVLVMESHPTWSTNGILQTSYHLYYGSETHPLGTIPANVWFQFWTYAVPGSRWTSQKFLYPCYQYYPCPGTGFRWLMGFHNRSLIGTTDQTIDAPPGGRFIQAESAFANHYAGRPWNSKKMFQNLNQTPMLEGIWYQVRLHFDTSGPQGVYEAWRRQLGETTWTKLAEWIGGVTPGFDFAIPEGSRNGNRVLAMPTTVNTYDSTIYVDDFIMATSLQDLESRSSSTTGDTTPPAPPQNPRITP
ncbi:MAG: hypothetical protein NNA23_06210 [Nitrospira sp.]|nr:hypothetical protein [Nitrospira sp.]